VRKRAIKQEAIKQEAIRDAYSHLRERVAAFAPHEIIGLESGPNSSARRAVIAEIVDDQPSADQEVIRELTASLVAAINDRPIGIDAVDVETLNAMRKDLAGNVVDKVAAALNFGDVATGFFKSDRHD
jgi:hypothetical protein